MKKAKNKLPKTSKIAKALKMLAILGMAGSLIACQAIPTEGGVHEGLDDFVQAEQQVVYRPDMPVPDASQEDIVRGFLQAASSSADDYQIARQFLTAPYQNVWRPYTSVLIDEGSRKFTQSTPTQTKFTLNVLATVDETGAMNQMEPGKQTEVHFELRRENGQWRISAAPNGVILDRTTFRDVWSQQQLYFWGVDETLVPDPRWFLNRGVVTTQIVEELIAGPQVSLAGSLLNAFPNGTSLTSDIVLVEAGVAQIDVTSELLNASARELEAVAMQMATTLNSVPGVSAYSVSVNKAEVLSGVVSPDPGNRPSNPTDATQWPAIVQDGEFGFLAPTGFITDTDLNTNLAEIVSKKIVVGSGSREVIAQSKEGIFFVDSESVLSIDARADLLEPSLDRFGYVWSATKAQPNLITITLPGESQVELEIPWLEGVKVEAFKVSPDATKIAFLIADNDSTSVIVTGIVRTENGTPNYVVEAGDKRVMWVKGDPIDMDWIDTQRIAVLEHGLQGSYRLALGGLGMIPEDRPAVQNAVSMHGATRISQMLLLDNNGDLWAPQGSSGWQRQTSDVALLSKRG